nr:MAG TPA: hypothetical protein [Caudoviricetes sp.]
MKNFIFAMCGFLMMSLVSLSVQASSISEPSKCEYVNPLVDVGLPDIQSITFEAAPVDYFVLTAPQPVLVIADSPAMQMTVNMATQLKQVTVPQCPFRYIYKSKYCTHYSYTAYSRLITPY